MSNFQPNWFYRHCLAAGLLSLISFNSQAELVLEEVIVTAEKKEESLQETPIAITTMTGEDMQQQGITQTSEVANFAPNVLSPRTPSSNSALSYSIRGVGSSETSLAKDSNVGLYIDGVTMGRTNSAAMNIVDVARIEVLRGPQGTLYGRNTTGGAINIVTQKPTGEFGLKQGLTAGSYGLIKSTTAINLPKFGGFSTKLNYMFTESDSYFENIAPSAKSKYLGNDETQAARIAINWDNDGAFSADFTYDITDREGTARPFQLVYLDPRIQNIPVAIRLDQNRNFVGTLPVNYAGAAQDATFKRQKYFDLPRDKAEENKSSGASLTLSWDLNDDITLKSITAYREMDITNNGTDLSGGNYGFPLFFATGDKDQHQISQELQLLGGIDDDIEYITGLFYFAEKGAERNPQTFLYPLGTNRAPLTLPINDAPYRPIVAGAPTFAYTTDNNSYAVFGQITKQASANLDVTMGVRYTKDEREAVLTNTRIPTTKASDSWDDITGLFVVDYQFNEDINTYFKFASGYNAGGYNIRASNPDVFKQPFDQEELDSYEIGLKSQLFNRRMRVNAAIFYNDYKDIQVTRFTAGSGGASNEVVNAGKAKISGLEIEATALLSENWRWQFSYGHTDFRFNEYISRNALTGQFVDVSDKARGPRTPRHSATNSIIYENAKDYGLWVARIDQSFKSAVVYDAIIRDNVYAKSRNLINARFGLNEISIGGGELSVGLWGKNLTDEEYVEWGIDFGAFGFAGANFGDPKTYGLDLSYKF